MNRIPKFRFWATDKKEWVKLPVIVKFGEGDISVSVVSGEANELPNYVIWSQFTGLKDKNGKEIYEGDILEAKMKDFIFHSTIEMGFSPTDGNEYGWHWKDGAPIRPVDMIDERMEIIGNLYENPELLKTK